MFKTDDVNHAFATDTDLIPIPPPLSHALVSFSLAICFLSNRKSFVKFNDKQSALFDVDVGVPQGGLTSPSLFSIYTYDLPKHIKNAKIYQYADDTVLLFEIDENTQVTKIEDELQNVTTYCKNNFLKLNLH